MLMEHCLRSFSWRMPWWIVHYLSVILPLAMSMVSVVDVSEGKTLPLHWNATNPIFTSANSMLDIQVLDNVAIICPKYSQSTSETWEYYIIYMVSGIEYDVCRVFEPKNVTLIVNCSAPNTSITSVLWIKQFQPVQGVPNFRPGKKYYFISTSTGTKGGIGNQVNGACQNKNMKLVLNVLARQPDPQTTKAPPNPQTTKRPPQTPPRTKATTTTRRTTRPTTPVPTTAAPVITTVKTTTEIPPTRKYPIPDQKPPLVTSDTGSLGVINSAQTVGCSHIVLCFSILLFILTLSRLLR